MFFTVQLYAIISARNTVFLSQCCLLSSDIKWDKITEYKLSHLFVLAVELLEKNFIERLDSFKKLIPIWSSGGLSIYIRKSDS